MAKRGTTVKLEVTPKKRELFLEALKVTCNVTEAARLVEVSRTELYRMKREEEDFARAWEEALQVGAEALEDELIRRAKEGVLKPVFYKGEVCGEIREYSDTLGIFLLKGAKPEKYKERVEQEHKGGIDLTIRDLSAERKPDTD